MQNFNKHIGLSPTFAPSMKQNYCSCTQGDKQFADVVCGVIGLIYHLVRCTHVTSLDNNIIEQLCLLWKNL
jgi:hypothetical protein